MPTEADVERPTAQTLVRVPDSSDRDLEAEIITEARNGSATAIEQLVERYERRLFRTARNITGNHEDSEEVVQNAFVKAFRNLASFRGDSRFYTWLTRIAVNEGLMKIRGRRPKEISIDDSDERENPIIPEELQDWGPTPEERYSQEELRTILETTIDKLAQRYRIVFQLRDIEGFSTEETAQMLGLSIPSIKTRLRRARIQLRNSLDIYFRRLRHWRGPSKFSQLGS
jgi:RNA polymerase sigma-70 factor (ECF subfamily)